MPNSTTHPVRTAIMLEVMIASPSDAEAFQELARRAVDRWNRTHGAFRRILLVTRTGSSDVAPEAADRTQDIANRRVLARSEILIAVFWTRIGTSTGAYESGTVEEIMRQRSSGKRVMIYFADVAVRPSTIDLEQYRKLLEFKKACSQWAWVGHAATPEELASVLYRDVEIVMNSEELACHADGLPGGTPSPSVPQRVPRWQGVVSRIGGSAKALSTTLRDHWSEFWKPKRRARTVEERAALWIVRSDRDPHSEELQKFLSESPRHRAAYLRLAVAWKRFNVIRKLRPLDHSVDPDLLSPHPGPGWSRDVWTHATHGLGRSMDAERMKRK